MESDDSDSQSVRSEVMEPRPSVPAGLEEDTAEEAGGTELKYCSVVLDRLQVDDRAERKELEEKEDMNRKGGKPVSRIPTFHKRPTSASQTPEPVAPKKDAPVPGAQPPGTAASGSAEASRSKPPDVRETALPFTAVHDTNVGLEAPSLFSSAELAMTSARTPLTTAPKTWGLSEPAQYSSMTASPRPAIRPEYESEQHVPVRDQSKAFQTEADAVHDPPEEEYGVMVRSSITLNAAGDKKMSEAEDVLHTTEVCQEEAILDEQPPWETEPTHTEPTHTHEFKDSRSSSDVESEEEFADEKGEGHKSVEEFADEKCEGHESVEEFAEEKCEGHESVEERHEPLTISSPGVLGLEGRADVADSTSPVAPARSIKSSGCSSFALFCVLPTALLLLGGLSQHVWHYGLPLSVAQLTAQLELHWLEGFIPEPCSSDCRVQLVESIPVGLYQSPPSRQSIADSWLRLLDKANSSVQIAAFYFTLRGGKFADSSDSQGRLVFEQLKGLKSKGVKLQIAVNAPQTSSEDTAELAAAGAEVREVDLQAVTGGIVHTKLWVVDQKHFYLGSANMDWRSLSQVKEVGLSVEDCSCLAQDAARIFGLYWSIGGASKGSLPPYWPARLSALSSSQNPLRLKLNGVPAQVYLSSAPPQISARGRSDDLSTILSVIGDARSFIHISVMDYLPLSQYTEPLRFWPAIDSALRAAACTRGVQVRLLVSCWKHSPAAMFPFLQSLLVLGSPQLKCDINVKMFTVASTAEQMKIPFARVNHAKYMVTDRVVYIGTSNWSENYFTQTAGVGLVVNQTGSVVERGQETLQSQAEELFLRDWMSQYASRLSLDDMDVCPRGPH
ncbi:5'-3' exonuclease PLD3 isoform X2 [Cyclopterus lumpus]|uniref:Phospholipase D family, member 7 n=1 Tax=Cyclopterus lumpus TaxID=8103 RepID=A0A8C3AAS8_CYCLU|nr:5'-3' exonuclease PLD3 isoform X2 [Cyclopterus lumpus]